VAAANKRKGISMLRLNKVALIAVMMAVSACSTTDTHKSTKKVAAKPAASSSVASSHSSVESPMVLGPSTTGCDYPAGWVGHKVDRDAVKATGRVVRILHPNDPATMDFSPNRLNVIIDKDDIVTEVKCG
jgi:hypothetical protein